MDSLEILDAKSPCQQLCVHDCYEARHNLIIRDKLNIAGLCPKDCNLCLYAERFKRDDVNWIPQLDDSQYKHWSRR